MLLYPNAKINLGLQILEKRTDGFHSIETLFVPIDLCDILELVPSEDDHSSIKITGIELDSDPGDNLVLKAWQLMHNEFNVPPVKIHLHKIIPVGAGLGGGSADAAFMLKGINEMFNCNCEIEKLEELASMIGSDCAFFIRNQAAIGTGRGEILESFDLDLDEFEILLINPAIHISSKEAYAGVVPAIPEKRLRNILHLDKNEWKNELKNDFEVSVFKQYSEIKELKDKLLGEGAFYAAMTGSGSSVFGLFHNGRLAEKVADYGNWFTFRGKLLASK